MIAGLKPYPAMKDSGVEWLGEVPEHWEVAPGKACYHEKKRPNVGLTETTVLSLSYGRIIVKPKEKLHGLVPASFETYQIIEPGEIICRPTDLQNDKVSLRFGCARNRGIITSAYMCLATREGIDGDFGYLLLHAYDLKKIFYGLGSGLRQNLDWSDFRYLPCVVPPHPEQAAIARFLDHVDRRIHRYLRAKQKLIGLLEEQKQVIIHRAVTRGLDPDVPLKPSGVEWLGDVPEHWGFNRGKFYFREVDVRSTTGKEELLSVSHITGVTPRNQKNINMFKAKSYIGYKLCNPGQIAVNTMWAWMAAIGVSIYHGIISSSYHTYEQINRYRFNNDFLDLILRSTPYKNLYTVNSTGITTSRLRLYPEDFLNIRFLCPPRDEQESIVGWIRDTTNDLDAAIDRARREIELLREYRTRLIADVVTGKLDVREAAANLPEETDDPEPLDEADDIMDEGDTMIDDFNADTEEVEIRQPTALPNT